MASGIPCVQCSGELEDLLLEDENWEGRREQMWSHSMKMLLSKSGKMSGLMFNETSDSREYEGGK